MVFVVSPDRLLLNRLFFLKEILQALWKAHKKVGVWGAPECVLMEILSPPLFSRLRPAFLEEEGAGRCRFEPAAWYRSALRIGCRNCIVRDRCAGLGNRPQNLGAREYRSTHTSRRRWRDALFRSSLPELRKLYRRFADYVDRSDLRYADRYLYFVQSLDYGSAYSQNDRFVYHCDYLPDGEVDRELAFLRRQKGNGLPLSELETLLRSDSVSRFAYSKGVGKGRERESYYFAPSDVYDHRLLEYFRIPGKYDDRERLIGIGVDYYDGRLEGYKLYFDYRSEKLWRRFPAYLERIGIDPMELHPRSHYYVQRLDPKGDTLSERIDLIYDPRDFRHYVPYFSHFDFAEEAWKRLHLFALAFDFVGERIGKINLYYRNAYR
jgi:hypothetical protein